MLNQVTQKTKDIFLPQSHLLKRGWTQKAIKMFLGEPDQIKPNPHYRSGAPMKLFSEKRVEVAERSQPFQTYIESIAKRRAAAQERAAKKLEEYRIIYERESQRTMDIVENYKVGLPDLSYEDLSKRATRHWENHTGKYLDEQSNEAFLHCLMVNFLRHVMTSYDAKIRSVAGRHGSKKAILYIQQAVFDAISSMYPYLAEECKRQLAKKKEEYKYMKGLKESKGISHD